MLPRTGAGEALFVKQLFNAEHVFNVSLPKHSLAGGTLHWFQLWELGLPEAQHISWKLAQRRYFSDAEIELVGDHWLRTSASFTCVLFCSAHSSLAPARAQRANCWAHR